MIQLHLDRGLGGPSPGYDIYDAGGGPADPNANYGFDIMFYWHTREFTHHKGSYTVPAGRDRTREFSLL